MEYAIEVQGLTKKYKTFKLDDVSFKVPCGSIVGFVGENGAGKTTTIKGILDLIHKDAGNVKIMGKALEEAGADLKEDIGVVFDGCFFHDTLKSKEINKIMKNIYRNWQEETFLTYLKKFNILEDKLVKEMSRGMKMKLSLAVALSHKAKVLILDEATSGLDPIVRDQILDIFLDFIQDEDHSIFVSTHIISDLEKVADYITFIHDGKIVFTKSKDELIYNYGLVKCTKEEYGTLDQAHIRGARKGAFGYEVMVDNRPELEKRAHNYVIDPATIEEIILFQTKEGIA